MSMSDDDLAALEAEIDAEDERTSNKRRATAQSPAHARRAPPPPPTAATHTRSRPAPAAGRTVAPADDAAMLDDDFHDPYDAIDFKHIAQLTADLRQQAAANDMADEDDGDHLAGIGDDAVTADLRAIMLELQAEGVEADDEKEDAENDEERELAQLEKEQDMEEKQQPPLPPPPVSAAQQQTQSRMQAEQIRPTPPPPPIATPPIDQQLSSLQQQFETSRRRALEFMRAGKKAEAMEAMKSVKVLEARIRQLESRAQTPSNTTPPSFTRASSSTSTPPPIASTATAAVDGGDLLAQLRNRLVEYQRTAIGQKQAGRLDRAQALLLEIRRMKVVAEEAEKGTRVISAGDIPPHPDVVTAQLPRLGRQSSGGASKTVQTTAAGSAPPFVAAAPPPPPPRPTHLRQPLPNSPPVPPRSPAGGGLTTKQSLLYEHLIASLTAQTKDLQSQVSQLLADASSSSARPTASTASANAPTDRTHKLLALQYHRLLKRTQADVDLLRTAFAKHIPPPTYHTQDEKLTVIHEHKDVGDDQLHLHLVSARDLDPAASYTVTLQWEGGGQVVAYSSGSERGPAPEWKCRWPVVFGVRSKTVVKAVQRSRVVAILYRQRLIMGSVEVGRGEMKLKELVGRCDKRDWVKVKDGDSKRVGEVCVEVRLRRPLERLDMREVNKQLLLIDEFEQGAGTNLRPPPVPVTSPSSASHPAGSPSSASRSPAPSPPSPATTRFAPPAPTPVSPPDAPSSTATPSPSAHPPLPPGVTDADISDPHSILAILSNDVLEWEINTHIPHTLTLARQRQDNAAVEDCMDRLTAAQTQLSILVQAVQAGKLTLDDYLGKLRENIERDGLVARELMRRGRKEDAKLVIQRVQLMRNELKTAEENADELE